MDRDLEVMTRKWREWCVSHDNRMPLDRVPHLLAAVVKDEREACAKIAEGRFHGGHTLMVPGEAADMIAETIRERIDLT